MSASHPLDNPIWHALSTQQERFAQGTSLARRYVSDIAPFGAVVANNKEAFDSLASLIAPREVVVLMGGYPEENIWKFLRQFSVIQMVYDGPLIEPPQSSLALSPLSSSDVPAMLELVEKTHPGPFMPRTIELGCYISIWQDGQLAAMAGERFHVSGYHEISAVCTHPNFQKRGYARQLILQLIHKIQSEGDIPFLHVVPENKGAIALYEALGFKQRIEIPLYALKRQ
jgi:ribosomal protein S18 acetylase RimI-like enzyme